VGAGGDVNTDRSPGIWSRPESLGLHYRYSPGNQGATTLGPNGEGSFCEAEQWYHIAGVKKDAELTVYINGEEKGKYAVPAEHALGPGKLYFGKSPRYRASTFVMDDFVIYNRALTQDEIVEIMGGDLSTPVDPAGKLASAWGNVKSLY
jgi:hypothetical protein